MNSNVRRTSALLMLLYAAIFSSCDSTSDKTFRLLPASSTGIDFNNHVMENDSMNMLKFTNFYTGSGVGIADINNDGLEDVFFGSCMGSSKLYLNKGNLKFEEITKSSGTTTDRWITGVSMVDINQDGFIDIYLSVSGPVHKYINTENMLFINNGDLTFSEQAASYGLNDSSQTTHGSFFDYDKDGDLDLFSIINPTDYPLNHMGRITMKKTNGQSKSTDKLYRNNGDGTFSDVSREAGILFEGYSLGLNTSDFNHDGWVDVFVTNDFVTNDLLYINNGNGTFTNQANYYLKHTSFASMGTDAADINNDGLQDIYSADMYPEDNYREKTLIPGTSYNTFYYMLSMGYEPQYPRNVLQINNGNGTFSEIGQMAGVDKTDWSWSTLFADFNNNGFKDLFVANGFVRDVGNLDYLKYDEDSPFTNPKADPSVHYQSLVDQPGFKLQNYLFENNGDLTFTKVMDDWGFDKPSFSYGAGIADLDKDGDLDLVISNINDEAFVYENRSSKLNANHYLQLKLQGDDSLNQVFGSKVTIRYADQIQYIEHNPYRGYLSTITSQIHFGLGDQKRIDKLEIIWPDGKYSEYTDVPVDTLLVISRNRTTDNSGNESKSGTKQFEQVNAKYKINFRHVEDYFTDFKLQPLIPHELSKSSPCIAVGDINNDGLEDFFVGGSLGEPAYLFKATGSDSFEQSTFPLHERLEDVGALFFDADNDDDLDLYVVTGGNQYLVSAQVNYQDRLYFNDGTGNFSHAQNALPEINASGSTVVGSDFDKDGDIDLFIGGGFTPGKYPITPESFLLENNKGRFTNIAQVQKDSLSRIGMVNAALWTDFNNDSWVDLIVVGEWMQITIFENQQGKLANVTEASGLADTYGWWNSIVSGDFDMDGDLDYVVGNLGLNTNYDASVEQPFCIYTNDFDRNGTLDPIMCQYYENGINYPIALRDDMINQITAMKKRFRNYDDYAKASFNMLFSEQDMEGVVILKSQTFQSSYVENLGDGTFAIKPLPVIAQMSPIYGMAVDDFNADGYLDVMAVGNSYVSNVTAGRYDASTGALFFGDGTGNFTVQRGHENGINAEWDAKALVSLVDQSKAFNLYSNNNDSLYAIENTALTKTALITPAKNDVSAQVELLNGKTYRKELYFGEGFLSQSSRNFLISESLVAAVYLTNIDGKTREVYHK